MIKLDKVHILASFKQSRGERKGQAYFNALYETDIELATSIRGTDIDPFYDDAKVVLFLNKVTEDLLEEI
jgi:hypothetical protein